MTENSDAADRNTGKLTLLLITGMSGAGKSTALKALEDIGYEALDNLPLSLLPNLIELAKGEDPDHINPAFAIGIDARTRNFRPDKIISRLQELKDRDDLDVKVLYFDSNNTVLAKRFTETRRRHPLAIDRPVSDGIVRERQMLEVIRAEADYFFDTSDLGIHELKRMLSQRFERRAGGDLNISISSFGYPKGLPRDADLVFDVRFLKNPHYEDSLRPLTGEAEEVGDFIKGDPVFESFWDKIGSLILSLLPEYKKEGKSYLTIAFGCTGGRHRSVFVARELAELLREHGYWVNVHHRELLSGE
ncbi:RNase adapter RapZ [Emcibacter nanhaiensis]|uniref:RNase adapter RapZ n=1 Tax=Emcibacter nanhaiensis TaxID=1505037 RepID=A0A501PPC3_9PROT|nr:RNase adapter RapZ [Emcibacter nanhaiensis]TPD61834.1 RNase adapter RapZ [Emcibacter nanhaiensis]